VVGRKPKQKRPQWPTPRYDVGSPDFIHAVGVLSANYNLLEFQMRRLLELYSKMPYPSCTQLFLNANNQERLNLLGMCCDASAHPLRIRNRVHWFARGYDTCTQNRNIIMHSETVPIIAANGEQEVQFRKPSKKPPFLPNTFAPSIKELRHIADATYQFQEFGKNLFTHIIQNFERQKLNDKIFSSLKFLPPYLLPHKPKLPKILNP
jgi:hypothetical protein